LAEGCKATYVGKSRGYKRMRLIKAFRRPRKRVKFNRTNILARDRWRCQYCGKKFNTKELTYDHVVPKARGGTTCWENIVTCCIYCNGKKGDKKPQDVNLKLKKRPTRPDWVPIFSISLNKTSVPESWRDFCYWNE
jgi:5-methylcytosine-specific restriction endonuclease McrA